MKKLIAKTRIGTEFLHSTKDCFFASANAQRIADILNDNKYQIKDGEKWHVYDFDFSQSYYVDKRIFRSNTGAIKVASI
jgi:phage antirepressor YoqD-like protein